MSKSIAKRGLKAVTKTTPGKVVVYTSSVVIGAVLAFWFISHIGTLIILGVSAAVVWYVVRALLRGRR